VVNRPRTTRGASTLGCLFAIMILLVIVYYGVDIGRVYWSFYKFQDEMETSARFASTETDEQIRQHLKGVAQDLSLPAEAQRIVIRRTEHPKTVTIRSQYTVEIVLPFKHKEILLRPNVEVRQF
jgi:hypothetical protein